MDIKSNFSKEGDFWIADDVEITDTSNLHLETNGEPSSTSIYQSTVENGLPCYLTTCICRKDEGVDIDLIGEVFPKYITIKCNKQPSMAIITSK